MIIQTIAKLLKKWIEKNIKNPLEKTENKEKFCLIDDRGYVVQPYYIEQNRKEPKYITFTSTKVNLPSGEEIAKDGMQLDEIPTTKSLRDEFKIECMHRYVYKNQIFHIGETKTGKKINYGCEKKYLLLSVMCH